MPPDPIRRPTKRMGGSELCYEVLNRPAKDGRMMSLTRNAVHRSLPAVPKSREPAMIISVRCVTNANGKRNASTVKCGYAMTKRIGLQVTRQESSGTGYAEETNACSGISRCAIGSGNVRTREAEHIVANHRGQGSVQTRAVRPVPKVLGQACLVTTRDTRMSP